MKVKQIVVHNVLGVRDIDVSLEGHHLWLVGGKNRQGKSSVLNSFVLALCGPRGCDYPDVPLTIGADEGWVKVTLVGDGTDEHQQKMLRIERKFERRDDDSIRELLRVVGDDGFEAPTPQALLNDLYKFRGFDPLAFTRLRPKEQIAALRAYLNLDFTELDESKNAAYAKRTEVNRSVKDLEHKVSQLAGNVDESCVEPVDVSEISKQMTEAIQHNAKKDQLSKAAVAAAADVGIAKMKLSKIDEARNKKIMEIELLQRQLLSLDGEKDDAEALVGKCEAFYEQARHDLDGFAPVDVSALQAALENSHQHNAKVDSRKQWVAAKADLAKASKRSEELTKFIEDIEVEKKSALESADWPVSGMTFSDEGVLVNNVPFAQCSKSEQIRASVKLAIKSNPNLPVMVVEHGECMDDETLAEVERIASEFDYQILVEFMTRHSDDESRCQLVMEAGVDKKKVVKSASPKKKKKEKIPSE